MTTKHTPGPWTAYWLGDAGWRISIGSVELISSPDCNKHDIRLIAAAPELLEALRDAIIYLEGWPADSLQRRTRERARAAIAKATGTE